MPHEALPCPETSDKPLIKRPCTRCRQGAQDPDHHADLLIRDELHILLVVFVTHMPLTVFGSRPQIRDLMRHQVGQYAKLLVVTMSQTNKVDTVRVILSLESTIVHTYVWAV